MIKFRLLLAGALIGLASLPALAADALAGAAERIDANRKGDVSIVVTSADGKPVADAEVAVEQTSHAFLFGGNIFCWGDNAERYRKGMPAKLQETYRTRFAGLFNYATLPVYWHFYEPEQGQTRQAYIGKVAAWCKEHQIVTKGHPLMWNYLDPAWMPADPATVRKLQLERVNDIVPKFAGSIDRWDVANELTEFARAANKSKAPRLTSMWDGGEGLPLAKACFRAARQANPNATLLINDYHTDAAYVKTIQQLVDDQGKPLYDVIGIQSHQHNGPWTMERTWDTCQRFAALKAPLHFTELTLLSGQRAKPGPMPANGENAEWVKTPEGEAAQAKAAERFYTLLFSHPSVEAITWWDLLDGYCWQGAPAGLLHEDGTPKPAYETLKKLIHETWHTKVTVKTDANGRAAVRGFYGEYRATTLGDAAAGGTVFKLAKGAKNEWAITLKRPIR